MNQFSGVEALSVRRNGGGKVIGGTTGPSSLSVLSPYSSVGLVWQIACPFASFISLPANGASGATSAQVVCEGVAYV